MATNDYHFITQWRFEADIQEVVAILRDAQDLPRWWPSVYLEVEELAAGDENGIGKQIRLYTKGWLPYTLRWQFRVTESNASGFTLVAEGDFVGRGIWTFAQEGKEAVATYDWRISAEKPLLRAFSFLLKPIFSMNHHWAMAKGAESLRLELQRRHAPTESARRQIAPPPAPTPNNPLAWLRHVVTAQG
jgi:hypothetical protein